MGGKGSKTVALHSLDGLSREELSAYFTSVTADMAAPATRRQQAPSVPEIRVNNRPVTPVLPPGKPGKLRSKIQKQLSSGSSDGVGGEPLNSDQVNRQLALLDGLENKEDSADWAHMRDWLLYHLHETLDSSDEDDITAPAPVSRPRHQHTHPRRPLHRQMSMDSGRITQRLKLGQSASTPASSFESTSSGGGRASYQSSFDSGTGGGDT